MPAAKSHVWRAATIPASRLVNAALVVGVILHDAFDRIGAFRVLEFIGCLSRDRGTLGAADERIILQIGVRSE